MDGVGISIIERPRPLPGHDTPNPTEHPYTLKCEEPLFFPIGNTGPAIAQVAEAKAVCRECEVVGICLQWAIDNNQDAGVWGGMSEEERRALKRRAARARRAGC